MYGVLNGKRIYLSDKKYDWMSGPGSAGKLHNLEKRYYMEIAPKCFLKSTKNERW